MKAINAATKEFKMAATLFNSNTRYVFGVLMYHQISILNAIGAVIKKFKMAPYNNLVQGVQRFLGSDQGRFRLDEVFLAVFLLLGHLLGDHCYFLLFLVS